MFDFFSTVNGGGAFCFWDESSEHLGFCVVDLFGVERGEWKARCVIQIRIMGFSCHFLLLYGEWIAHCVV